MKLISCYIENFGGLCQYERSFDPGLTVIYEPNGFGKTTLAEFIRAMFYGFPRAAKTLDKNPRKKYLPWNGGVCGGNLTFELEGKEYRIHRTFGTVPKGDTFSLFDLSTNKKSDRFTENIGVEIFGLDGDSFERSTYMPQMRDIAVLATDSIRAKLGDLVEDAHDINHFDKAIAALRVKRSGLEAYRGSGGAVTEAKGKVSQLQAQLDALQAEASELAQGWEDIRSLEEKQRCKQQELDQLRLEIVRCSEALAQKHLHRQWEDLQSRLKQTQAELEELHSRYPKGFPSPQELEEAYRHSQRATVLAEQAVPLSPEEQIQYEQLLVQFSDGLLEQARLDELAELERSLTQLEDRVMALRLSDEEELQHRTLEAYFANGVPGEGEIQKRQRTLILEQQAMARRGGFGWRQALRIIPALLGAAGAVVLALSQEPLWAGASIAVGGILTVMLLWLDRQSNRKRAAQAESEVQIQLEGLYELQRNRQAYLSLRSRIDDLNRQREQLMTQLQQIQERLSGELGCEADWDGAIGALRLAREQFLQLQTRKQQDETVKAQLQQCRDTLADFFCCYGLEDIEDVPSRLRQVEADCHEDFRLQQLQSSLRQQAADFRSEHKVLSPVQPVGDMEQLRNQEQLAASELTALAQELLLVRQHVENLRSRQEQCPELQDSLEFWQQKKEDDARKVVLLDDTMAFLQQARENLSNAYLGTVQTQFAHYLGKMSGYTQEKLLVNGELEVYLERLGQARQLEYFSAGQKDMVMLCMRFALVDALFGQTQPFVILDDPFVNLDDARMASAMAVLRELAQQRQILYLVCNSSRADRE